MKKILIPFVLGLIYIFLGCSEDSLSGTSVIVDDNKAKNDFDKWISKNYTLPYNIEFKYRFEDIESDMNYNLQAADYRKSIRMAKMIKFLMLDTYDEVTGSKDFMDTYFPKLLFMVGSPAYRNNGTIILATAENGLKINIYNVNSVPLTPLEASDFDYLNEYYFKTLHHEFAHILHQTKPYPTDFKEISGVGYVLDSWNTKYKTLVSALTAGFISPYASKSADEDFAETFSIYITSTPTYWNAMMTAAGTGASPINEKLEIVKEYMNSEWGLKMDDLRTVVLRRQTDLLSEDLDTLN